MIFEKRSHLGLEAPTVRQDRDSRAWFQAAGVADDLALRAGDDAVAARQDRLRIEVRESGGQPVEVGAPAVLHVVPGAAQLWCQCGEPAGVACRVGAAEQQAAAEAGQFSAGLGAGLQQPGAELDALGAVVNGRPTDTHWTEKGQDVAAEALARELRERGLVPAKRAP